MNTVDALIRRIDQVTAPDLCMHCGRGAVLTWLDPLYCSADCRRTAVGRAGEQDVPERPSLQLREPTPEELAETAIAIRLLAHADTATDTATDNATDNPATEIPNVQVIATGRVDTMADFNASIERLRTSGGVTAEQVNKLSVEIQQMTRQLPRREPRPGWLARAIHRITGGAR